MTQQAKVSRELIAQMENCLREHGFKIIST